MTMPLRSRNDGATGRLSRGLACVLAGAMLLLGAGVALVWHWGTREPATGQAGAPSGLAVPVGAQPGEPKEGSGGQHDPRVHAAGTGEGKDEAHDAAALGAYLARVGNCMHCHTARGGVAFAGGRALPTPFGTVYSGNLTPDAATGLGRWTADDFWRAMHHGKSRDGRLLAPVFPYAYTTHMSRADSDALFAYLRALPPVTQIQTPHQLRWPFGTPLAFAAWRALHFRAGSYENDSYMSNIHRSEVPISPLFQRGAYLVRGLGHCSACHGTRSATGGVLTSDEWDGGPMSTPNWYAPALNLAQEGGVAEWPLAEIVALLGSGQSARGVVTGPMAQVVQHSTQYLSERDILAMATFLKELPQATSTARSPVAALASVAVSGQRSAAAAQLYETHCADCHGVRGEGLAGAYPPLAGNRAVALGNPANLIQIVMRGGFAPSTAAQPRPYGMPPFVMALSEAEIAAVLTHIRSSWGNQSAAVSELDVARYREALNR